MIRLKELLNESTVGKKIGSGMEQTAYAIKNNPNYIIKKYNRSAHKGKSIVDKIENLQRISDKYPDLFAKIKIVNKDTYIQEKLDIKKLDNDIENECIKVWNKIADEYKKAYNSKVKSKVTETMKMYIDYGIWKNPPKVKSKNELDEVMNDLKFYIYHTEFLIDTYVYNNYTKNSPLVKKLKPILDNKELSNDPHNNNFGYDKNGRIKVLDI